MKDLNNFDPEEETRKYAALPFYLRLGQEPDFYSMAPGKMAQAFVIWKERVGQNRPWDHKPIIREAIGGTWHKQGKYHRHPNGGLTAKMIMDEVLAVPSEKWGKGVRVHVCK